MTASLFVTVQNRVFFSSSSTELETNSSVGHLRRAGQHRLLRQRRRGDGDVRAERDAPHAVGGGGRRRGDGLGGRVGLVSRGVGQYL